MQEESPAAAVSYWSHLHHLWVRPICSCMHSCQHISVLDAQYNAHWRCWAAGFHSKHVQRRAHRCLLSLSIFLLVCYPRVARYVLCRVVLFAVTTVFYILLAVGMHQGLQFQLGAGLTPWPSWAWWIAVINSWLWMSLGAVALCGERTVNGCARTSEYIDDVIPAT